ncbi:hypothetical protein SUNI508_12615 [Seiridium unicorne]|uniref:Uncharacterized protein n=1 Tax=Seiridium unicorne TaxID=138068 RepID=A0ABR2VHU3_9PEZI
MSCDQHIQAAPVDYCNPRKTNRSKEEIVRLGIASQKTEPDLVRNPYAVIIEAPGRKKKAFPQRLETPLQMLQCFSRLRQLPEDLGFFPKERVETKKTMNGVGRRRPTKAWAQFDNPADIDEFMETISGLVVENHVIKTQKIYDPEAARVALATREEKKRLREEERQQRANMTLEPEDMLATLVDFMAWNEDDHGEEDLWLTQILFEGDS